MLTGLSGMLTSLVMEPTGSPLYSILNLCTTFVIIMYNSSRAKRCPMQDLKWQNICTDSSQSPSSHLTPWPKGRFEKESAVCLLASPLTHRSGTNSSGSAKLAASLDMLVPTRSTTEPAGTLKPPRTRSD